MSSIFNSYGSLFVVEKLTNDEQLNDRYQQTGKSKSGFLYKVVPETMAPHYSCLHGKITYAQADSSSRSDKRLNPDRQFITKL